MSELTGFVEMGLSENIINALKAKGFEEPTPIQRMTIPLLLKDNIDIIGQAQTGTGKTAAFGIPIIEKIQENTNTIQALILTPTRELALQVAEEINSLKGKKKIKILPIYGGQNINTQLLHLKNKIPDIIVGTPGRILDHINRKTIDLSKIRFLILDEADEMLNMGFIDDIESIFSNTPIEKQVLLFSATMPDEIMKIAKKYMKNYEIVKIKKDNLTTDLTEQIYFEVREQDKFEALCRILDIEEDFYGIIFCRTKVDVDNITSKLIERGYDVDGLHGDITQYQREKILSKFKNKKLNILVATDVAARGIDISDLTHVINYSLPQDPESYVHRIGRTGRAGKQGTAITFVSPEEYRKLVFIKKITKTDIKKGKIPEIKEVIEAKKNRIKQDIVEILKSNSYTEYFDLAKELIEEGGNVEVIASVLKYSLDNLLDETNYNEIKSFNINTNAKTRLFVAIGKQQGYTPKKLIDFIREYVDINPNNIQDIQIFDSFSFLTVPFEDAEIIINAFKKKNKKSLFEIAKDKIKDKTKSEEKSKNDKNKQTEEKNKKVKQTLQKQKLSDENSQQKNNPNKKVEIIISRKK